MKIITRTQAGYNLVEVIIALAVFGVVAMTIFTLFVMGRRNVYSGKQASQAVAVGTQVLEDIGPLNKRMLYNGAFGIADTDDTSIDPYQALAGRVRNVSLKKEPHQEVHLGASLPALMTAQQGGGISAAAETVVGCRSQGQCEVLAKQERLAIEPGLAHVPAGHARRKK